MLQVVLTVVEIPSQLQEATQLAVRLLLPRETQVLGDSSLSPRVRLLGMSSNSLTYQFGESCLLISLLLSL